MSYEQFILDVPIINFEFYFIDRRVMVMKI